MLQAVVGTLPQYAGLENLYLARKDRGLVILGIPSDDFRQGEPGSNPEIKRFCRRTYDVTFPMMSKVFVRANIVNIGGAYGVYEDLCCCPLQILDQRSGGPLNVGRGSPSVVVSSHSLC